MPDVCLNLGAGTTEIDGYTSIDRNNGSEVYPLKCEDSSVEEIYASHVFEHFSHIQSEEVMKHWVAKLKPGGRLRVAVPDFDWITKHYRDGKPINTQGYIMGGHTNGNDHHGSIFDRESLTEVMRKCGLERIGSFKPFVKDATILPVSLNLQGFKPSTTDIMPKGVYGVLSAPRYGPVLHFRAAFLAFQPLSIPYHVCQGAYWHQILCETIEDVLALGAEYVLTVDYDSVFGREEVQELYRLMQVCPEADAICGLQIKRGSNKALFSMVDKDGKRRSEVPKLDFQRLLVPVNAGHFGLTIIRRKAFASMTKPWMCPAPDAKNRWGTDKIDADISFWNNFRAAGLALYLAPKILVGHMEEMITWPSEDFTPIYQTQEEYIGVGIPAEVKR